MATPCTVPQTPTREQIEAFRTEHHIPDPEMQKFPWVVEENMVLAYLCSLALEHKELAAICQLDGCCEMRKLPQHSPAQEKP